VEVFAQNGLRTITDQVFPDQGASQVALFAEGGTAQLKSVTIKPMAQSMFVAEATTAKRGHR
jgi:levanase